VRNTGTRAGEEVVQLYVRDLAGNYVRPVKEPKGFEKLGLQPGEAKTVTFQIDGSTLSYASETGEALLEPGQFQLMVGPNSRDLKPVTLTLK
jgi:beta-glucosidase